MNDNIEIFLQGEGIGEIKLVRVPRTGTVRAILEAAQGHGLHMAEGERPIVLIENAEEVLDPKQRLDEAGIGQRSRVHVHRCRTVEVRVNFNADQRSRRFSSAATVGRVKEWAVSVFALAEVDATEHVLQTCGGTVRPDEAIHIGTLVRYPDCSLCFDLVPVQRIEG